MTKPIDRVAMLQVELKERQAQGLTHKRPMSREPMQTYLDSGYYYEIAKVRGRGVKKHGRVLATNTYQLVEVNDNRLFYAASCPRCGAPESLLIEAKFQYGSTIFQPEGKRHPIVCFDCALTLEIAAGLEAA